MKNFTLLFILFLTFNVHAQINDQPLTPFQEIKSVGEGKNGAVKYAIPVFEMGDVITEEINDLANIAASKLQSYVDSKKEDSQTVDEPTEAVDKEATEEELAELPI